MGIMKTTTIGDGGTITIPEELLVEAGFEPGMPLEITAYDGRIEIEPASPGMRIEMRGRVAVLVPIEPIEGQPPPDVDQIIEELREERMNEILGRDPTAKNDRRR
ncbi:MAG TPA: AbrB/MazE/SpoVT family DNA-binding domain-containing protein [Thermoanaerobaculia bacterium]|nr:AbrB/MazE/SpoVT family DNA-binding domain-containing protein [Thermoanaerobaculia bacterium]